MANLPDRRRERYLTPADWASYTMNRMLEDFFPGAGSGFDWVPAVDVIETRDTLEVRLELPGLCKDEIDIQFSNGVLTIKGEKKEVKEEDKAEKRYHHREMRYGSFVRAISVPVRREARGGNRPVLRRSALDRSPQGGQGHTQEDRNQELIRSGSVLKGPPSGGPSSILPRRGMFRIRGAPSCRDAS